MLVKVERAGSDGEEWGGKHMAGKEGRGEELEWGWMLDDDM